MELAVPFPLRARVLLSMSAASSKLQIPGVVRVAHTDVGMGVEFTRNTDEQRQQVETFLQTLMQSGTGVPELLVQPEGLEPMEASTVSETALEDPLLELFRTKASVPVEVFQEELRKQRGNQEHTQSASA
jgi:hypothetical protein